MNITDLEMAQAIIEIFGGFICLMLLVIIIINGYGKKSWKLLKWMLGFVSLLFFAESCAYIFRGNTDGFSIAMTRSSNFCVFMIDIALISFFIHYMYSLLQEKGAAPGKIFKNIVNVCVAVNSVILVTNLFTGWMYYFDGSNYYHRNTGWYIYTALMLVCILTSSAMCIRYRRVIRKTMLAALLFYAFVPVIAIVLQAFIYGISITNIGIFVALILMLSAYLLEWSKTEEKRERPKKFLEILALFMIMAVSMSASIISCIFSINHISEQNAASNSQLVANAVSAGIENEFIKPIMVARTMANDYNLKDYLKKAGKNASKSMEKEVASYLDSIRTGFGYQMVFAVGDASGAHYTSDGITRYMEPEKKEQDIWYQQFAESGKQYELNVDMDESNQGELSVFVNARITDRKDKLLGVCGVSIKMTALQELLKQYEKKYDIKIDLIDADGLVQVDSNTKSIERKYLDDFPLQDVASDGFYEEEGSNTRYLTKYMENLGWYLVVEDCNAGRTNVIDFTTTSIIIFAISLIMMGIVFFIVSTRERKTTRELLEKRKLSFMDDMTGFFNRRAYEEDCKKIEETNGASKITMIMMDVNGLKTANDTCSHMAGDELIIGTAKCIQNSMGEYGKIYRIGGDEFIALLECSRNQLHDMLKTFEHMTAGWKGKYQQEISVSKGIVVGGEHTGLSLEEMKELADKLMYQEKDEYYRRTGKVRRKI